MASLLHSISSQTFGGPKPLYLMMMISPSDQTILRHPPQTHPYQQLHQFQHEMNSRCNINANAGNVPIAF